MARPLRIEYPGAYYHVMNRGQSRRNIFIEDKGRQTFLDLLADVARLWKVEIYASLARVSMRSCRQRHGGMRRASKS